MKSRIFFVIGSVCILIISGCSKSPSDDTQPKEKQPFYITTVPVADLRQTYYLKKTGKLQSSSEITVTAQVGGRVVSIAKKLGETVNKNQLVVKLQDTAGTYGFASQRANSSVTQAKINYDQTLLALEKAIQDSQFGLQQAQNQASNSLLANQDSAATTQLDIAKKSYEKAQLDYETKLKADQQTIDNYLLVGKNMHNDIQLLYETVLTKADQILGVTDLWKYSNDDYEHLLGARNTSTKTTAEDSLRKLIQEQKRLSSYEPSFNQDTLVATLQELWLYTRNLSPLLNSLDFMLQNTLTNSSYSETQLALDKASIDAFQSQLNGQVSTITSQLNTIQSFFSSYEDIQISLAKAVELAKSSYENIKANLQTAQTTARVQVDSLTNTLTTVQQNKETTQKALENSIRQAQISANEAGFQLSKLSATAPIQGIIKDIFVDIGQEVMFGTPLFALSSLGNKQIDVIITQQERQAIGTGVEVILYYNNLTNTGVITQLSATPNVGVSYKAIISTQAVDIPPGTLVQIGIPVHSSYTIISLNRVRLINTTQGKLILRDGKSIHEEIVSLGKVHGDQIEITNELPAGLSLVTSDTKQYDPEKYMLVLKEKESQNK